MDKEIGYEVRLKYAKKKVDLPVVRDQKIAEFLPIFESNRKKGASSKVEVRTRVFLPEFLEFAKRVGFFVKGANQQSIKFEEINVPIVGKGIKLFCDDYSYLRLMIFGVVMSVLKKPAEWRRLEDCLLSMEPIPLRYWASKFRNAYWKYQNQKKLRFLARRFLEVEWI